MVRTYFQFAWRNITKSGSSAVINIGGLSVAIVVTALIALWIRNELSFDKHHRNYKDIAQVMQHFERFDGTIQTNSANPAVMGDEIRKLYNGDFKHVVQATSIDNHAISFNGDNFLKKGAYMETGVADMLTLTQVTGNLKSLPDMNSVMLSSSLAKTMFGRDDPTGKLIRLDNKVDLVVTAVYEDLPMNSSFHELKFILPWQLFLNQRKWISEMINPWSANFTQTYVQINAGNEMKDLSYKIRNIRFDKLSREEQKFKQSVFLHPMKDWHLRSDFKDGKNIGGKIDTVWLFGITGGFVLLLACINFMNLSTARSQQRAREVGIRKAMGSGRLQLMIQFLAEAALTVLLASLIAGTATVMILPYLNSFAATAITIPWTNGSLWMIVAAFIFATTILAGFYPAIYLSSFKPVKTLSGLLSAGRYSSLPRNTLVVVQFAVSVSIVIGTVVVYQQIQSGRIRSVGYDLDNLVMHSSSSELNKHLDALKTTLKAEGLITNLSLVSSPTTAIWNASDGFDWEGRDPSAPAVFSTTGVDFDYGATIGWQVKSGRDFLRELSSDSMSLVLNESAATFIGIKEPVGKIIRWNGQPHKIIGVVQNMLVESPYKSVSPQIFHIAKMEENLLMIRLKPSPRLGESLNALRAAFKKYDSHLPFKPDFVDEEFNKKFSAESVIAKVARLFGTLAIFISAVGLFGLTVFAAEKRKKEIGVRKVLGASVQDIWKLFSKEFLVLVLIACAISIPFSYLVMNRWLESFEIRAKLSVSTGLFVALAAMLVCMFTVSFQAIKTALTNPVKSLRTE